MGTLRRAKVKFKLDRDLRKMLVRGSRNEILLDLDGDKIADIGLIDEDNDGDLDTLAFDLAGRGDFDLYLVDSDKNGIPDAVLFDEEGDGELKVLGMGPEVEDAMLEAAARIAMLMAAEEYIASEVDAALAELDKEVNAARRELKKRR